MSDDMGMAEEAMNDAIVESAGYDDEQATAPDEAEALIRKNADMINGCLARITELEAQITALKEIAITEKAYHIYYRCQGDCGRCVCSAGVHKKDVRDQLAKEHPEAFR